MSPAQMQERTLETKRTREDETRLNSAPSQQNILIATIDPEIHLGLTELFQSFSLNTIWLQGVESAKNMLARQRIAACFCGFWLQDGTYRELVRHIRRERMDIPVIIVSTPACPEKYPEYLSAINLGALDFLSHPYKKSDFERMLRVAIGPLSESIEAPVTIVSNLLAQESA